MTVALFAALLAVLPLRPFPEERLLLDRRLESLRRILPEGPATAADLQLVRELAGAAGLARVEAQARAPVEAGPRGEVVLDVTALGGFEEVNRFFQKLALSHRLVDVESLSLTATTEDVVQLVSVLRVPYWPAKAPLPPAPESPQGRPAGVAKPTLDAFLRDQALAFAKSEAIAARRRARRTPRLFLSELAAAVRDRPVVVGYAALAEEFTIRGVAVGEGPLRALEGRLERGFFRLSDFLVAKQGACHRFEVHGRSPVAGPDAELPVPVDDPFEQDATPCRADRDEARRVVIQGRAPTPKDPGRGPLTLRLRDVDLSDVFQALATLGFGAYVVDGAVAGRASVELTRVTLDEALAAIRKATGVEFTEIGPVRRVSLARPSARSEAASGGAPASFALKRTEVRDVLAAMADLDPSLASLGPPGFLGRVSVWTRNAPLGALRSALLDAAALSERVEDERRILERGTGAREPAMPVARSGNEPRLTLQRADLTVGEFELAGVGSAGEAFVAFAYTPTGQMQAYAVGERLSDAVVRSVESTDAVVETEAGPVRLLLPALER